MKRTLWSLEEAGAPHRNEIHIGECVIPTEETPSNWREHFGGPTVSELLRINQFQQHSQRSVLCEESSMASGTILRAGSYPGMARQHHKAFGKQETTFRAQETLIPSSIVALMAYLKEEFSRQPVILYIEFECICIYFVNDYFGNLEGALTFKQRNGSGGSNLTGKHATKCAGNHR
ncbi:hypothetical protein Pelo_17950 [Pelomyxa schiedti]|nr:hypothetical protein Pelo_17950 [Pelomyxa schiedti]